MKSQIVCYALAIGMGAEGISALLYVEPPSLQFLLKVEIPGDHTGVHELADMLRTLDRNRWNAKANICCVGSHLSARRELKS